MSCLVSSWDQTLTPLPSWMLPAGLHWVGTAVAVAVGDANAATGATSLTAATTVPDQHHLMHPTAILIDAGALDKASATTLVTPGLYST
ncbi:unnamed protein product [Phytophthora fragariaefolia]|uniref:Unnamed protein product n=1 Tax=Phytophthora fragariaefolia TaxID=1490495 RepID=A0A9W6YPJ6_9STRA|nr:unnamed protein product [Phytophthora fragariaefolia]